MRLAAPNLSDKNVRSIIHFPLFLVNTYIFLTLTLFYISPMFSEARNGYWSIAYGIAAMTCFSVGFMSAARFALRTRGAGPPSHRFLNYAILAMCVANLVYFVPLLRLSFSYYGFASIFDVTANLGENYHTKNKLMEELGSSHVGILFTLLNLFAFTHIAPYVLAQLYIRKINFIAVGALLLAGLLEIVFFLSIGTMSGLFYIIVLLGSGWLCRQYIFSLDTRVATLKASRKRRKILLASGVVSLLFFAFMIVSLASRADQNITFSVPVYYSQDSIIYKLLGQRLGDGFSIAIFYLANGWYGLGNSFDVDFHWTEFRSFSRVLDSYVARFLGETTQLLPQSYPVRQEMRSGYPAFAYWHTIFPWFASDFTFAGTLVVSMAFGALYGWSWVKAIREGCSVYASLFGLLSIGAIFINANSQILDNKQLALALVGLLMLIPLRRIIPNIRSSGIRPD
jgi:hypothetical protein